MSFIVQIIDAALPGDATQRQRLIERLVEEYHANDSEPGEALAKLYQQLVAQYPCFSTYKADVVDECAWGDGPLISDFGQRIAVLDITQNEEQVLAFILKLAGDLNLKVVDVQTDIIYYPKSQEAIDFIAAYEMPALKEKPLTEKSVLEFIVNRLKQLLEPEGFAWDKKEEWFQRNVKFGTQFIWIGVQKIRDKFVIYFSTRIQINRVAEIVRGLKSEPSRIGSINYSYGYFSKDHPSSRPEIRDNNDLARFANELDVLVNEQIIPFMEMTLNLDKLNSLTNSIEMCKYFLGHLDVEALTLAYLVAPSKIQETADIYRNYIRSINYSEEGYQKPIDDIVNKLIELNPTL